MSRSYQEEEKKQGAVEDDVMEFIDTSSKPQHMPSMKPQGARPPEEKKRQTAEDAKAEAFMSAKTDDPLIRSEQMAEQLRKSKRQELISKRRYPTLEEVSKEMEESRRRRELHEQRIYGMSLQEHVTPNEESEDGQRPPMLTVEQFLSNHE